MTTDPLAHADRWFSDVLSQRAAAHPAKDAFVVVGTDGSEKLRLTYADLHDQVERYAAGLIARGLRGSRALMLFEPGAGFVVSFLGCLRAGVVAFAVPFGQTGPLDMGPFGRDCARLRRCLHSHRDGFGAEACRLVRRKPRAVVPDHALAG